MVEEGRVYTPPPLEVVDREARKAWTNPVWFDD